MSSSKQPRRRFVIGLFLIAAVVQVLYRPVQCSSLIKYLSTEYNLSNIEEDNIKTCKQNSNMYAKILNVVFVIIIFYLITMTLIIEFRKPIKGLKHVTTNVSYDNNDTETEPSYNYIWKAVNTLIGTSTPPIITYGNNNNQSHNHHNNKSDINHHNTNITNITNINNYYNCNHSKNKR